MIGEGERFERGLRPLSLAHSLLVEKGAGYYRKRAGCMKVFGGDEIYKICEGLDSRLRGNDIVVLYCSLSFLMSSGTTSKRSPTMP